MSAARPGPKYVVQILTNHKKFSRINRSRNIWPEITCSFICFMKHMNEFIFSAYTGHRHEAIFLTGIPDIRESLPYASPDR